MIEGVLGNKSLADVQRPIDLFRQYLAREIGQDVKLEFRVIVVDEFRVFRSAKKAAKTIPTSKPELAK